MSLKVISSRVETNVLITSLTPHPKNANEGDVGAVIESISTNGWYGDIKVCARTNTILMGHTRVRALVELGDTHVPKVDFLDVDEATALRLVYADNRATRLGVDNKAKLIDGLTYLAEIDGLLGSLYTGDDLDQLISELDMSMEDALDGLDDDMDQPMDELNIKIECASRSDRDRISIQLSNMGIAHEFTF